MIDIARTDDRRRSPRSVLVPAGLPDVSALNSVRWDDPRERDLEESFCWHMYAQNHDVLRQLSLPSGSIPDVLVFPRTDLTRLDVVELKRDVADRAALGQLLDYLAEIREVYPDRSRPALHGVLVAPRLGVRIDDTLPVRYVAIDPRTFELAPYEPRASR